MKLNPKDSRDMTPREMFLLCFGVALGMNMAVAVVWFAVLWN